MDDLAATFAVSRSALNIVSPWNRYSGRSLSSSQRASAKGMFSGSALVIHLRGGGIVTGNDKDVCTQIRGEKNDADSLFHFARLH